MTWWWLSAVSIGKFFNKAGENLYLKANQSYEKYVQINLHFNPSRTKTIYFAKELIKLSTYSSMASMWINARPSNFFNSSLTFRSHYESAVKNCQSDFNPIKLLTNKLASLPYNIPFTIYKSLIRSKIGFAHSTICNLLRYIARYIQTFEARWPGSHSLHFVPILRIPSQQLFWNICHWWCGNLWYPQLLCGKMWPRCHLQNENFRQPILDPHYIVCHQTSDCYSHWKLLYKIRYILW